MAQESIGDDILYAPIRDLAERLRTRRLSPVALTEAYLDRLQKIGPRLNAVVVRDFDRARAAADEAESSPASSPNSTASIRLTSHTISDA